MLKKVRAGLFSPSESLDVISTEAACDSDDNSDHVTDSLDSASAVSVGDTAPAAEESKQFKLGRTVERTRRAAPARSSISDRLRKSRQADSEK